MTRQKISATVSPELLRRAHEVTGERSLSEVLDRALTALVEHALEDRWLAAHDGLAPTDDLPGEVAPDLAELPWDGDA